MKRRRVGVITYLLLWAPVTAGQVFETTVPPGEQDRFKSASFRIWLPPGTGRVRALIVHQHGCGRNGITNAQDLHWQALARKHDAALLGTHLVPRDKCTDWHEPGNGSADAYLAALKHFAGKSRHPELEQVPWCLWGHSGGAHWAVAMAGRYPDRVVAVFARSGGQPLKNPPHKVPILFQLGAKEKTDRFANLYETAVGVYEGGRANDAPWTLSVDPKSSHDTRNSRMLAIPYFDAMLSRRLGPDRKLRDVDRTKDWLGNDKTFAFAPAARFEGERAKASWLVDEGMAARWRAFGLAGDGLDPTPPAPPRRAATLEQFEQLVLIWKYDDSDVDLESGIRQFVVYLDGRRHADVVGQKGNYGDEPEPVEQTRGLLLGKPADFRGVKIEMSAINHAGLESGKTTAFAVLAR